MVYRNNSPTKKYLFAGLMLIAAVGAIRFAVRAEPTLEEKHEKLARKLESSNRLKPGSVRIPADGLISIPADLAHPDLDDIAAILGRDIEMLRISTPACDLRKLPHSGLYMLELIKIGPGSFDFAAMADFAALEAFSLANVSAAELDTIPIMPRLTFFGISGDRRFEFDAGLYRKFPNLKRIRLRNVGSVSNRDAAAGGQQSALCVDLVGRIPEKLFESLGGCRIEELSFYDMDVDLRSVPKEILHRLTRCTFDHCRVENIDALFENRVADALVSATETAVKESGKTRKHLKEFNSGIANLQKVMEPKKQAFR